MTIKIRRQQIYLFSVLGHKFCKMQLLSKTVIYSPHLTSPVRFRFGPCCLQSNDRLWSTLCFPSEPLQCNANYTGQSHTVPVDPSESHLSWTVHNWTKVQYQRGSTGVQKATQDLSEVEVRIAKRRETKGHDTTQETSCVTRCDCLVENLFKPCDTSETVKATGCAGYPSVCLQQLTFH